MSTATQDVVETMTYDAELSRGQEARVEDLNQGIFARFAPEAPLQPAVDFRPTPTKYARFPVTDLRGPVSTPIQQLPAFRIDTHFTPPVGKQGPVSGYGVDNESQLQNRFFGLNLRGSGIQNQYIPGSDSDLYHVKTVPTTAQQSQPFPGLFKPYPKPVVSVVPDFVGHLKMSNKPFGNSTRTQLRYDATGNH